jgi:hypothetical protein
VTLPVSLGLSIALPVASDQFASCVHFLASPVPPSRPGFELHRGVLESAVGASTCHEALAAMPTELLFGADPRCPEVAGSVCYDESHAVFCGDQGFGTFSRCSETRGGTKCVEIDVDGGRAGVCARGPCEGNIPEARCEKTTLHTCDPRSYKLEIRFDCAWMGLKCSVGPEGYQTCVSADGDDARCPTFGVATCEGDRVRFCTGGEALRWSTFSCGEIGATCQGGMLADGGGPLPFCLHADARCSPLDASVGACAGDVIDLCVDGAPVSFDCASIGKRCDPRARACL